LFLYGLVKIKLTITYTRAGGFSISQRSNLKKFSIQNYEEGYFFYLFIIDNVNKSEAYHVL